MSEPRVLPALSAETIRMTMLLREVPVGEVITFEAMSLEMLFDVTKRRQCIYAAIKTLERDEHIKFSSVRGVGYKRLDDEGAAQTIPSYVQKTRRAAKRGLRRAKTINITNVPLADRGALVAQSSYLALVEYAGAPVQQRKLKAYCEAEPQRQTNDQFLSNQRMLEALKANTGSSKP